jgi:serine/threonine protein kinase
MAPYIWCHAQASQDLGSGMLAGGLGGRCARVRSRPIEHVPSPCVSSLGPLQVLFDGSGSSSLVVLPKVKNDVRCTRRHMAPEIIAGLRKEGRGRYDEKVDTYSFAVSLWELATGFPPFVQILARTPSSNIVPSSKPF